MVTPSFFMEPGVIWLLNLQLALKIKFDFPYNVLITLRLLMVTLSYYRVIIFHGLMHKNKGVYVAANGAHLLIS